MKIVKTPNKEFDLSALYMDFTNNSNFHYDEEQYLVIKDISEAINTVLRTRKLIRFFKKHFCSSIQAGLLFTRLSWKR